MIQKFLHLFETFELLILEDLFLFILILKNVIQILK